MLVWKWLWMRDKDNLKTACEFDTLLLELNVLNLLLSSFQIAYFHQQMTRIGQMDFLLLCYPKQIFMFQAIGGKALSPRFKFWIIRFKEFFNLVLPNRKNYERFESMERIPRGRNTIASFLDVNWNNFVFFISFDKNLWIIHIFVHCRSFCYQTAMGLC